MRITETRMIQMMAGRTMEAQSGIAKAAAEVSTGVAVSRPSDDPMRWADGMRTKLSMDRRDVHESTVERARDNLTRADVAFAELINGLSDVRELAMAGTNGSASDHGMTTAALEIGAILESMIATANVRSIDGEFIFAGTNSNVPPFDNNGVYQGNDIERQIEVGEGVYKQASVTGSLLTAASGIDIFDIVTQVRDALAAGNNALAFPLLTDLDAGIEQLAQGQAEAGVAANSLDDSIDTLIELEVSLAESFETSVGADPIESATRLAGLSNQLEASRLVSERIVAMMSLG